MDAISFRACYSEFALATRISNSICSFVRTAHNFTVNEYRATIANLFKQIRRKKNVAFVARWWTTCAFVLAICRPNETERKANPSLDRAQKRAISDGCSKSKSCWTSRKIRSRSRSRSTLRIRATHKAFHAIQNAQPRDKESRVNLADVYRLTDLPLNWLNMLLALFLIVASRSLYLTIVTSFATARLRIVGLFVA